MTDPRDLTIGAATDRMRKGELTARELLESCLARIDERDDAIRAWVEVYAREAIEEAHRCDCDARSGKWRGDLHGIPVGVKDIIDVKGMWTRAGTSIYPARVADADAPAVRRLKAVGAIIVGKTETTPFANNDPTVTRNPWNPRHTPGGSSEVIGNLIEALEAFKKAGARIVELKLPDDFSRLIEGWSIIKGVELAAFHRPFFELQGAHFPPKIKMRIEKGFTVPGYQYAEMVRDRHLFQKKLSDVLSAVDAAIMPVAATTAPEGLASTGSSIFNRPWTFTGFPAMSIPSGLDAAGLPFAIQMAALPMAEAQLLSVAAWCEQVLSFDHRPLPYNGAAV